MRFIGCKTQLLDQIKSFIDCHAPEATRFCDIFSGSAAVARHFKQWYEVTSNDVLFFSYCLQRATVQNDAVPAFAGVMSLTGGRSPLAYFNEMVPEALEVLPQQQRFFQNHYAPAGGRMYLTDENALRIDYARNTVNDWLAQGRITEDEYYYLVACIVEGIPYVSNIAGTYGAFNKFWDARSKKRFALYDLPVTTNGKDNRCYNEDGLSLLQRITGDILYIDPPYNARQYPTNYHVLETAARYDFPELRGVTGQRDCQQEKSAFCSKRTAVEAFGQLMRDANFRHIILSYNTDGILSVDEIREIMQQYGKPETFDIRYIPYRRFKSRNTTKTEELKEMLVYIEKEVDPCPPTI